MLTENQQKWVDALRSGDYEQTSETLQDEYGYCCLGVGCVVAEQNGVHVYRDGYGMVEGATLESQALAKEWLGLADDTGSFKSSELVEKNDEDGKSFAEIADLIESNPPRLFVKASE